MLEATHLRGRRYAVRPSKSLGTHGSENGVLWSAEYVNASSESDAIRKFQRNEPKWARELRAKAVGMP